MIELRWWYSLQKSVLEAAGDESLLLALDHLVTRVDAKREPVIGDEVMRVVQRRLFADLGSEEERQEIAREHADLYRRYGRQLADTEEERRNVDAEADRLVDRIMASYPFHPALLDLMHQRWTTLPSYQRTRGSAAVPRDSGARALEQRSPSTRAHRAGRRPVR